MDYATKRSYFFDQGLRFECQQCGACCTGEPGFIFVDKHEVEQIAKYISQNVTHFIKKYLYPFKTGYSIKEYDDGRCYFYQKGCAIYPVRPVQCRLYPFWFENLRSLKKWRQVTRECPGIGTGPIFSKQQIMKRIHLSIDSTVKRGVNGRDQKHTRLGDGKDQAFDAE